MRRSLMGLTVAIIMLIAVQAQAFVLNDWTLNFGAWGGPTIQHINSIGMNGSVKLTQNVSGAGGTVQVGDTFTIVDPVNSGNPIVFTAGSYVNSTLVNVTPLLATGQGVLTLATPALSGFVSTVLAGNAYRYVYNSPGLGAVTLNYMDSLNVSHLLATFDLIFPDSGGQSTDAFSGGTGLQEGTSNMYGIMHVQAAGVLFMSDGTDLMNLVPPTIEIGTLSGGINYSAVNTGQQILATIASNDNFTLSVVPEPASLLLLGTGAMVLSIVRRRRTRC